MRAVWSFWTKPYRKQSVGMSSWGSEFHHLLAWALSFNLAKKHLSKTALYTDSEGARFLADDLGLEFDQVSTELNNIRNYDPEWWSLGKLYTYRAQREPFVHIDCDVFLDRPLPDWLLSAPVFGQNLEWFEIGKSCYEPELFEAALLGMGGGWLPAEWLWYRKSGLGQEAVNCGILGGSAVSFLNYYAEQAIRVVEHPGNAMGWPLVGLPSGHMFLLEQYLLNACVRYEQHHSPSKYGTVSLATLFNSSEQFYNDGERARFGYTHLIGRLKSNPDCRRMLERRVSAEYPAYYERCVAMTRQG